ncbi:hypothetical protein GCM10010399_90710 [Dactylosporangium fulvum]|uniref:Tetratricopeptide repeat-containing serine protease family protein n=1 Tax=Dactylosporangium fulvum TaxID=53359 RepID=A0ABY5WAE1_9ACTN|nr:tetratricopeptide repeat-containing serine protease family protein [Dactylosporangium fulvum]UWP87025.1 tetratricopeptide repeat-containing serine protease family protein [Dactylosporangium fulvum]
MVRDVQARVVEVRRAGGTGRGTGYAVAADLVLTAAHVVADDTDVRVGGGDGELPGTVAWRDTTLDAALVRVPARPWDGIDTRWATLSGVRAVPCTAIGYPKVQKADDGTRVEEAVAGFIMPATGHRIGRYAINVTSALPYEPKRTDSPWSGLSGAAVLTEDGRQVLGVLTDDPMGFEPSRLEAVPVAYLLSDPAFADLVGAGPAALAVLPEHPFLRPMYEFPPRAMTDIQMLLPKFGVVPYIDRPVLDTALRQWTDEPDPFAVALVVGAGGTGKTRLAAETCDRLRAAGWETGRVDDPVTVAVRQLGARTLLVVDYAEHQDPDSLRELVTALAERPGTGTVRLLLLARHHRSWWDWIRPAVIAGTQRGDALVLDLGEQPFDGADRATYAEAAATAFADRIGLPVPAPVDVDSDEYDSALLVLIAALLAVRGEAVDDATPGHLRTRLLTTLLGREQRHWYRGFPAEATPARQLRSTRLPERAILVTLLASPAPARLPEPLRLLDEFRDARNERLAAVAAWLTGLFAPGGRLDRIGPDPVVDWFLAQSPDLGGIAQSVLALPDLDADRQAQLINAVRLAAEQHAATRTVLVELLATNLSRLVKQAVESGEHELIGALNAAVVLCTAYGERLGTLARAAGDALDDVDTTDPLFGALGVSLSELVVHGYRRLAATDIAGIDGFGAAFAGALLTLATTRVNAGEPRRALPELEEAARILRDLAGAHPQYVPRLAAGLANLGACLADLKRYPEAVAVTEEAAAMLRDDAALGIALNNLGGCYAALDRIEEAVEVLSRAVALFDGLPAERRDANAWQFMRALAHLARCRDRLDDQRSAAAAAERAVALARSLVAANRHRYLPDLVAMLIEQSRVLARSAAVAPALEAVRLCEEPAAARNPRFGVLLAEALTRLADAQLDLRRDREALPTYRRAVTAYRKLADDDPGRHTRELGLRLLMTAVLLKDARDLPAAHDAAAEAATLLDTAAGNDPDLAALAAKAHATLGQILRDMGRLRDAIGPLERALTWFHANPDVRRSDFASALHCLGTCWTRLGRPHQALPLLTRAVGLYRKLTAADERSHLRQLAATLHSLGACWMALEEPAEAVGPTEEAIELHRVADRHGEPNPAALADCLSNLGLAYQLLDDGERAVPVVREAVAVYRKLAAADPGLYRSMFAGKLTNLSSCLRLADDLPGALKAAVEAVQVARRLAAPRDRRADQILPSALINLGAVRAELGMVSPALQATSEAAGLFRRLADTEPTSHLPELVKSVDLQSSLHTRAGQPQEALNVALDLGRMLIGLDPDGTRFPHHCLHVFELVGDRYADLADADGSASWWRRTVRVYATISRNHAGIAVGEDLHRLADKLDTVGRTGVAAAARRLAS